MKILVDEMPMDKSDCPYSEFFASGSTCTYFCQFHDSNKYCNWPSKCPFFMSFKDYQNRTACTINGVV